MEFVTLNTIINDLLNIIRGSNVSDSETISKRQIENWIHEYRAKLLKQDLDKGKRPNPDYIQEINYVSIAPVDSGGDNLTAGVIETEEYLLKSSIPIPNTLDLNFKSGFTHIGTPLGDEIQFVPEGRSKWQQYKKFTNNQPIAFLRNNYLYIVSSTPLRYITVRGVFEIPPEVGRFINPNTDQPYYNLDTKYPIPIDMVPVLKQMILNQEIKVELNAKSDITNDSKHNLEN